MTILKIYDPDMASPEMAAALPEFDSAVHAYADMGISLERYNSLLNPEEFEENEEIKRLIDERGDNTLPYIFVDDVLKMAGSYPTAAELGVMLGLIEDGGGCKPPPGGCGGCSCKCQP